MRNTYLLNENWLFSQTAGEKGFEDTKINLPFIHKIDDMPEACFSIEWEASERDIGKTAYLCFSQLSGDAEIYEGDDKIGSHAGGNCSFNILLCENIPAGKIFSLKVKVAPKAREDGKFVFAGVSVVSVSSSHFDMSATESIGVTPEINDDSADIHIRVKIIKPNNYDVVSYTIKNLEGETVASKTVKPTSADTLLTIDKPALWDGQTDASLYTLAAALRRDSEALDENEVSFGIRSAALSDGFFRLNNISLPLSGVKLSDCSAIKSDMENFSILDGNCIMSSMLPVKTDLLSLCDKTGNLFWYAPPYTGADADFEELKEFLIENRSHPSFAFVVCDERADGEYIKKFTSAVKEYAPSVFSAASCDIDDAADFDPMDADIIVIGASCTAKAEAYISVQGRFSELAEKYPEKFFAVIAKAPLTDEYTLEEMNFWHMRLWETFCRQKGVIAYIADTFTDEKTENGKRGIVKADRKTLSDAFWFYKAQFSAKGFIKISAADTTSTEEKSVNIRCFTNLAPLRILVNGKTKKYKAEKISDGVFIYKKIKLKKGVNVIEASAENECDRAEITRK